MLPCEVLRHSRQQGVPGRAGQPGRSGHLAYLNAAMEEWDDDPRLLMKAFRNVTEARGGVSELARRAKLDRVALSRALSGRGNPRLDTLAKVVAACGVKLRFEA